MLHNYPNMMKKAIKVAFDGMKNNKGGPFGAIIVLNDKIIARASNQVTSKNDPTAHAEIQAIRLACKKLQTFDLSQAILFTTCEPCPMCLGAIYWSRISSVYYGCTQLDAQNIDFDDAFIYQEIEKPIHQRKIPFLQNNREEALKLFEHWTEKLDKIHY
jgi:tRNA(Arg) A34 adenosine deaminase TadA